MESINGKNDYMLILAGQSIEPIDKWKGDRWVGPTYTGADVET